jgi:hypothetical protein
MKLHAIFALATAMLVFGSGCTTASSYRSNSLRINALPNRFTAELAEQKAMKVEEDLNRAFIADGRFAQGSGLVLGMEVTAFKAPHSVGTQQYAFRPGESYRFLPGIIVVTARWYDDKQALLEQREFAEDIMPLPGELSTYASVNRAIQRVNQRIVEHTNDKFLAAR